jgi:hypothetical protein
VGFPLTVFSLIKGGLKGPPFILDKYIKTPQEINMLSFKSFVTGKISSSYYNDLIEELNPVQKKSC